MDTTHATPELFAALAKAQVGIQNATKNASNPHFRSRYADLAEVITTIREGFAQHGLSMIQSTAFDGALVNVTTVIAHASGGFISSVASCAPAKTDAQGIGAATTYLRRYGAAAMAGISQEDDDGEAAAHAAKPETVSEAERARVDGFVAAIMKADEKALELIGMEIADAKLSTASATKLRATYSVRKHALSTKAAA